VVGLVRDLRGIASACSTRRPISLLFEWLYPTYTQILIRIAEAYYDVPEVACPLLKLFCEMVWNRQGRLNFECSSANGILLFRETSALLSAYGKRLAGLTPTTDAYSQRYKGIWLCMNMLTRTLVGNYVTFGVFALYNDPSLASALQVVIKLALSIPLSELLTFPKVVKAFYALLEALTEHHFRDSLTHLDEEGLVQVLVALREGIRSVDANICSQACNALDHLASYYVLQARKAGGQEVTQHLRYHPELLYQLLQELFELILYDDQINQWAVSRPIYSLSLLYPQAFNQIKEEFSTRRTPSHTVEMRAAFDGLMNDLQPNVSTSSLGSSGAHGIRSSKHVTETSSLRTYRIFGRRRDLG
jgi:exportin-7